MTNGTEDGAQQVDRDDHRRRPGADGGLSLAGTPLAEAGGVATVTATLSAVSGQAVTVDLGLHGDGHAASDYAASGVQIVIAAGSTSGTITLTGFEDALDEVDETIVVDIADGDQRHGGRACSRSSPTITDDDAGPTVALSLAGTPLAEAGGMATVTATLSAVSGQEVTVDLGFTGTAAASDYTASGVQIVIAAGSTDGSVTADCGSGRRWTRRTRRSWWTSPAVTNGTEDGQQQVTATITDDDGAPTVILSLAGSPLAEAGGVATVTATLSAVSGQEVTVDLGFAGRHARERLRRQRRADRDRGGEHQRLDHADGGR